MDDFSQILDDNISKLTLTFSREVTQVCGEIKVNVSLEEVRIIYAQLQDCLTASCSDFEINFINRGIENIDNVLLPRGTSRFNLTPHATHVLNDLLAKHELFIPAWLPQVFKIDEPDGAHNKSYLFDWATIEAQNISRSVEAYVILKLSGELQNRKEEALPVPTQESATTSIPSPCGTNTTPQEIIPLTNALPNKVGITVQNKPRIRNEITEHGDYVAKKYLWLIESAAKRGHVFALPIEELSSMLRENKCFYTDVELVHFPHNKNSDFHEMPDNYLTIDRKDNDLGYITGNVVVCSKVINALKDQMPQKEFEQAVALKRIMQKAEFNPNQLKALSQLMAMN